MSRLKSNDAESTQLSFSRTVMQSSSPERVPSGHIQGGASGVKDDVSVILRGVAKFFAPSPSSSSVTRSSGSPSRGLVGIRNDFAEIRGSFKSSLSRLSSNKAVSGISKFASQLLQFEGQVVDDDQEAGHGVPGTNRGVVRFVKEISKCPDWWTDFPLPFDYDFSMSHPQRQHALTIEQLVPEFLALRLNLCSYMNVEKFWLIYFLLLLPALNQHDFELLSTAKILEARSMLLKKLGDKTTSQEDNSENLRNLSPHEEDGNDRVTKRDNNISSDENQSLAEIASATKCLEIDDDTMSSSARWFEDTDIGNSLTEFKQEEDDDESVISDSERLSGFREARDLTRVPSRDGGSDWDKLSENSERGGGQQKAVHLKWKKDSEDESNDWFTVDHF